MNAAEIAKQLETLPAGLGPAALRALADAWEADPTLPTEIAAGNYEKAIAALQDHAPAVLPKILGYALGRFMR